MPTRDEHRFSRRDLLRLGGGAAAGSVGAYLLSACGPTTRAASSRQATLAGGPVASTTGLPRLESRATLASGPVQSFRSRPDLSPAAVGLDVRPGPERGTYIFMDSHAGGGQEGPIIIDPSGELVWFEPVGQGGTAASRAMNLQVSSYKGKPVLAWWEGEVWEAHGKGEYVIADSSYSEVARVRAGNGYMGDLHEFFLTPQGTAVFTCYGEAYADLSSLGGGTHDPYFYGVFQEVDVESGKVLFQWRSDEHVDLAESYAPASRGPIPQFDYFHINSICIDTDGNFVVSARNTWTIYKIDRRTGEVIWRMGGKRSDFTLDPGAIFAWQHDATAHPGNRISVFDNGAGDYLTHSQSRGLVLYVDEAERHVSLELQFLHPGMPLSAGALGNVQLLPGGRVMVGWALQASFTEFGPDGKPILDGHLEGSVLSYRALRFAWSAVPKEAPALAAERQGNGLVLFASWNGATEVDRWLVLGGQGPGSLHELGTATKAGFESQITLDKAWDYVAVSALSGEGHVLGRSKPVRVA